MKFKWKRVQVTEVCELIVDCVNKTAPRVDFETPYKMIRTPNIRNGRIDLKDCRYVDKETYEKWTRRAKVQENDVLLTREAPMGEVGFVNFSDTVFLGQRIMQYRADVNKMHPRFLYYSFLSPDLQHQFRMHEGSGSVVSHIRVPDCLKFKVNVPPLSTQEKIVEILGAIDDKLELNARINETLEEMAQALFKSWFVDFEPVHAKANAVAQGEDPELAAMQAISGKNKEELELLPAERFDELAGVAALFPCEFVDSELGEIPKGWTCTSFGNVVKILDSKRIPLSKKQRQSMQGVYPYYGATSIMDYINDYIFDGVYVLMGEDGSVMDEKGYPFVQYIWGKSWVNNHAHVLEGTNSVSTEQIFLFLKNTNVSALVTGAVQLKINQGNLKSLPFIKADSKLNKRFSDLTEPLFMQIRLNSEENINLIKLRNILLPKLLSGELSVTDLQQDTLETAIQTNQNTPRNT